MVCSQYPPVYGGAGKQAQLLSNELACRGWSIDVVTLDQDAVGSGMEDKVRVVRLLTGFVASRTLTRALTTIALGFLSAALIIVKRPAVVHVHGAYWWSIPPLMAARLIRARGVLKVTRDGEDDPDTVMNRRFLRVLPIGWLYGLSFKAADHVITLSNQSFDAASKRLPQLDKVQLVRNGVDVQALARTPARRAAARAFYSVADNVKVTTFVGYLVKHKGVLDLLDAWETRGPSADDELWLVGPYEGFYRELSSEVCVKVDSLQSAGFTIRLFGKVSSEDMPSIYWATDVFTLPSYAEGMPNSLAEAMVAGCRVVATDIAGITDIVDPTIAELVPPGDVKALGRALSAARHVPVPNADNGAAKRLGISNTATLLEELYAPTS